MKKVITRQVREIRIQLKVSRDNVRPSSSMDIVSILVILLRLPSQTIAKLSSFNMNSSPERVIAYPLISSDSVES
jgi:hypothetical protein